MISAKFPTTRKILEALTINKLTQTNQNLDFILKVVLLIQL